MRHREIKQNTHILCLLQEGTQGPAWRITPATRGVTKAGQSQQEKSKKETQRGTGAIPHHSRAEIHGAAAPSAVRAQQEFRFLFLNVKMLPKHLPCDTYNNKQEAGASDQFQ